MSPAIFTPDAFPLVALFSIQWVSRTSSGTCVCFPHPALFWSWLCHLRCSPTGDVSITAYSDQSPTPRCRLLILVSLMLRWFGALSKTWWNKGGLLEGWRAYRLELTEISKGFGRGEVGAPEQNAVDSLASFTWGTWIDGNGIRRWGKVNTHGEFFLIVEFLCFRFKRHLYWLWQQWFMQCLSATLKDISVNESV